MDEHISPSYGRANPWERQVKEGEREYAAFLAYRNMSYRDGLDGAYTPRKLSGVALVLGHSTATLQGWAASFCWEERVGAFDRELDRRKVEGAMSQAQRVEFAHARIRDKLRGAYEGWVEDVIARHDRGEIVSDRIGLAIGEHLAKYDRLGNGLSTENISIHHGVDLDSFTPEELETFAALANKARLTTEVKKG